MSAVRPGPGQVSLAFLEYLRHEWAGWSDDVYRDEVWRMRGIEERRKLNPARLADYGANRAAATAEGRIATPARAAR